MSFVCMDEWMGGWDGWMGWMDGCMICSVDLFWLVWIHGWLGYLGGWLEGKTAEKYPYVRVNTPRNVRLARVFLFPAVYLAPCEE